MISSLSQTLASRRYPSSDANDAVRCSVQTSKPVTIHRCSIFDEGGVPLTVVAELQRENEQERLEHEEHLDGLHPQTRCTVCDVPDVETTRSGGDFLCDDCVEFEVNFYV